MFADEDVICIYTREQAIEDGLLYRVDDPTTAGFDCPVVVTVGIFSDFEGDELARLLSAMWSKIVETKRERPDEYLFELTLEVIPKRRPGSQPAEGPVPTITNTRKIWCQIDEDGTATVMYPEER